MEAWLEHEVLRELVALRTAAALQGNHQEKKNTQNMHGDNEAHNKISFLLVLATCKDKHAEFVFFPSKTYEQLEELFNQTQVVSEDGICDTQEENKVNPSSSNISDKEAEECSPPHLECFNVGKAIFRTDSGEPLIKIEGSPKWQEGLKQKYQHLDAISCAITDMVTSNDNGHIEHNHADDADADAADADAAAAAADADADDDDDAADANRMDEQGQSRFKTFATHALKALGAAGAGGGAVVGATGLAAGTMGYTATGIAANSVAATIMSMEAVAAGGGVATGGFTATMQTIGAVGVMASPVGVALAAGGAVAGVAGFCYFHAQD